MDDADRLVIERACERLIKRFAHLNDSHDYNALADMFVSDGSFARPTDPGNPIVGREAIRLFFRDRPQRPTRHVMTNIVVDAVNEDFARSQCYVVLYSGERGSQVLVGAFEDSFRRDENDAWKFQSRTGSLSFT